MISIKIGNRVFTEEELKTRGILDISASKEEIKRETNIVVPEVDEIEKIFGNLPADNFDNHELVLNVYNRIQTKFRSMDLGLLAVYLMGYIYGIRTERKRKAEKQQIYPS